MEMTKKTFKKPINPILYNSQLIERKDRFKNQNKAPVNRREEMRGFNVDL